MIVAKSSKKFVKFSYSEIGRKHNEQHLENQDSVYVGRISNDTYCLVVADGVGSCKWAKKGSEAAVEAVKNLALKLSVSELQMMDKDEVRRFIVRDWKSHFNKSWNDYGTTLNFVIWSKGDIVIGQIGDGLIVASLNDELVLMTDIEEFYTVETYALAEKVLKSSFKIRYATNVKKFIAIAMTDGIGKELNLEYINDFKNYIISLINKKERDIEIESWMKCLREKNDDDKTIGLLALEVGE